MSFLTLDNLATWMLTNIRLSRYDDQFVNNLTLYITQHQRITTNQDALFKKVARKYVRQFLHFKINIEEVLLLNWSVNVVESKPEYTGANIKIENNNIIFRSPYNKNFLVALRKRSIYNLQWIKEERQYEVPYSPTTLKELVYLSADHFSTIIYCDKVREIIDGLSYYESCKYWEPTLIYRQGYYIASTNEYIQDAVKNIEFNNDLKSIAQLVKYGIQIDHSVKDRLLTMYEPLKVHVAITFHLTVEVRDAKKTIEWLQELGCDAINQSMIMPAINVSDNITLCKSNKELKNFNNPVVTYYRGGFTHIIDEKPLNTFKIIKFVNSDPVNLGNK